MTMADVKVEIDFASDPGDALSAATWTDVTSYVRDGKITRGRRRQLDQFQPGTCRIVLDNRDQRFDPNNTSSPYYPNVKPYKRVRVTATDLSGTTVTYDDSTVTYDDSSITYDGGYIQFVGYIESFGLGWRMPNDGFVVLDCVDGFALLANKKLADSVYEYEVTQDSPIHWWRLSESAGTVAVDNGSRGYDGTYNGSPTLGAASFVEHDSRTAVDWDGGNDDMTVAGIPELSYPWTVELFINADDWDSPTLGGNMILEFRNQLWIYGSNNPTDAKIYFRLPRDEASFARSSFLAAGTDYHIVFAATNASTVSCWINGSAVTFDDTAAQSFEPDSNKLLVADKTSTSAYDPFDGRMQHLAFYGSALSSSRASAHWSAVSTPWNGDASGTRIGRILTLAGWPSADRDLDTGNTTFGDADINGFTALSYIQLCEASENGHFFITRDGRTRFVQRHALITESVYNTSQATFDDSPTGSELPYHDLELDHGERIYNEVTVQRKYGVEQTAEDTSSQTSYLERTYSKTGLLMDSDAEAKTAAQWLLKRFREPTSVVRRMELRPVGDDDLWAQVLGRDLMERVTVNFDPPGAGTTFSQQSHIQGIEHRFRPKNWETTWWVSPVDATDYLILDDATYGQLDSNSFAY